MAQIEQVWKEMNKTISVDKLWAEIKLYKALQSGLSDERFKNYPIPTKKRIKEIIVETETLGRGIDKLVTQIQEEIGSIAYILADGKVLVPSNEDGLEEWEVTNEHPEVTKLKEKLKSTEEYYRMKQRAEHGDYGVGPKD